MATSSADDSQWKTGLIIVAAIAVVGAAIGVPLWVLEVPGLPWSAFAGGVVGGVLGFVVASYVLYGR